MSLTRRNATVLASLLAVGGLQSCADDSPDVALPVRVASEPLAAAAALPTLPVPMPPEQAASGLYGAYRNFLNRSIVSRAASGGSHDTLAEYAAKCDIATGIHVPAFNCDDGTSVPGQGTTPRGTLCNRPNVLNQVCDPGSKFQVLVKTADAVAVGHCRRDGQPVAGSFYNDIAVIQYNKKNGAVCFYQALNGLPASVEAPSNAPTFPWISPQGTEAINCTGCHDTGGLIRSNYLAQLTTPPNALPSTADGFDNLTNSLRYVGLDFVTNRSWRVATAKDPSDSGLACTTCHGLSVNNYFAFGRINGTSGHFATFATAASQPSKSPHSSASPIWMRPGQITFDAGAAASAGRFQACANGFWSGQVDGFVNGTPTAGCTFTPFGSTWAGITPDQVASAL